LRISDFIYKHTIQSSKGEKIWEISFKEQKGTVIVKYGTPSEVYK